MSQAVQIPEDVWQRVRSAVRWVEEMRGILSYPEPQNEFREPVLVKYTGTTGTSGAGSLQAYDGSTFTDLGGDPINLFTMNGEHLKQNSYYIAHQVDAEGEFVASPGAIRVGAYYGVSRISFTSAGFTVTEPSAGRVEVAFTEAPSSILVDGFSTGLIDTDSDTGIYSTNSPSVELHLAPASYGSWGVVNSDVQDFGGAKTFRDGIYVSTTAGSSTFTWITTEHVRLGGGAGMYLYGYYNNAPLPAYNHGGTSYCGLGFTPPSNGVNYFQVFRGFWDGSAHAVDPDYMVDMLLQGKYCVSYYSGGSWAQADGATGTIGPGATCRGGIVVGGGSTGLTGTVP